MSYLKKLYYIVLNFFYANSKGKSIVDSTQQQNIAKRQRWDIGNASIKKAEPKQHWLANLIFVWQLSNYSSRLRTRLLAISFIIIYALIALRLLAIATDVYQGSEYNSNLDHLRADIVDRHGNLLAVSVVSASLYANPTKILNAPEAVQKLAKIIKNLDKANLLKKLRSGAKFVWIQHNLSPLEHQQIYNLGLPGFGFKKKPTRIYIYGNLLSHILGYVNRDMQGLAGIEKYYNEQLTDLQGKQISANGNLQLSIDVRLQNILSEEIERTMHKFKAVGAAGIIVDPNNGEILALVSKPDFDPHNPGKAKSQELFNMATQGVYEIGSGMKALTIAVGLDTGKISLHDAYDLTYMKVGKFQVKDTHPLHGWQSVGQIFLKSSNIGVGQIILEIGASDLYKYLKKLKVLQPLDLPLPERARPLFADVKKWNDLRLITMSYGYGISQSPAHFVQAMVPVINGGKLYNLSLIKQAREPKFETVFKSTTSAKLRQLMRLVVDQGTGKKAEIPGYYIGAKTGTAYVAHKGKYDKTKRISSFLSIMPATNPKYLMYIVYNEPQGIKETFGFAGGGWTAAPTTAEVFRRIIALEGMPPVAMNDPQVQKLENIVYKINNET